MLNPFDSAIYQPLTITLAHFLWEGVAIGVLTALAITLLRGRSPKSRYGIYLSGMLLMAACLPVTFALVVAASPAMAESQPEASDNVQAAKNFPGHGESNDTQIASDAISDSSQELESHSLAETPPASSAHEPAEASAVAFQSAPPLLEVLSPYVAIAYFLGLALMVLRVTVSWYGGHRLRRDAVAFSEGEMLIVRRAAERIGLGRVPFVGLSARVSGPAVIGVLRPVVLLPVTLASGLTPEQLETILTHEFTHLRRYDHWVLMLQRLVEAVLFFHPAVWYVSRGLSVERENCCDDAVIAAGTPRMAYAKLLVTIAEQRTLRPTAAALAMAGSRPSQLRKRIERLFDPPAEPVLRLGRPWAIGVFVLFAAIVLTPVLAYVLAQPPAANEEPGKAETAASEENDKAEKTKEEAKMPPANKPPESLAKISRPVPEGPGIVWGEPKDGLTVGIGEIKTTLKSPLRPIIQAYLENRGQDTIEGIISSRARFVLELDEKFYVEADFGGPVGLLEPGKRLGPIEIGTNYFNQTERLELNTVVDQTTPGPDLTNGEHALRLHFKLDDGGNGGKLVASDTVKFQAKLSPYPVEEAVAMVVKELKGQDNDLRRDAALAAGKLRLAGSKAALEEALKDPDHTLRRYAAESLGSVGDRTAIEPLHALLNDAEMDVRLSAAESLVSLGEPLDPGWVEPVIKSKHNVFQNAIWLVRRHAGKQAVPALIRCLDANDPSVNSYYNYTLVWQIHACGGPDFNYHHDFDNKGTPEQVEENRRVLSTLTKLLEKPDKENPKAEAQNAAPDGPSDRLTSYIKMSKADGNQRNRAMEVVQKAQVIRLHYEQETPTAAPEKDMAFAQSLKASFVMPMTMWKGEGASSPPGQPGTPKGEMFLGVELVFSRLFGEAKDMPPGEWLEQMKRPLAEGYKLKKVTVVLSPSETVRKQSFEKVEAVMKTATDRLSAIQEKYGQLKTFKAAQHDPSQWDDQPWPRFPFLSYEQDVGPDGKAGRAKLSNDWCAFYFVIAPISGNPQQRTTPTREFPKQAIAAEWLIETANENLKQEFEAIVAESLKDLDALETALGNDQVK